MRSERGESADTVSRCSHSPTGKRTCKMASAMRSANRCVQRVYVLPSPGMFSVPHSLSHRYTRRNRRKKKSQVRRSPREDTHGRNNLFPNRDFKLLTPWLEQQPVAVFSESKAPSFIMPRQSVEPVPSGHDGWHCFHSAVRVCSLQGKENRHFLSGSFRAESSFRAERGMKIFIG